MFIQKGNHLFMQRFEVVLIIWIVKPSSIPQRVVIEVKHNLPISQTPKGPKIFEAKLSTGGPEPSVQRLNFSFPISSDRINNLFEEILKALDLGIDDVPFIIVCFVFPCFVH